MNGPYGTTRWFGDSWGAPVCLPATQIPTPLGVNCSRCEVSFKQGDQGLSIPRINTDMSVDRDAQHLDCFLETLGIKDIK